MKFIFSKLFKTIKLTKLIKHNDRYFVIEIYDVNPEYYQKHHYIHSISLSKFNLEKIKKTLNYNDKIVINADKKTAFRYHNELKEMGYKKIFILNWHKK